MAKILIVDDDPKILEFFGMVIKSINHTPFRCSNGRIAWEVLVENPDFDLLIIDVLMPEMDGKELIKHVREKYEVPDIPILIISSKTLKIFGKIWSLYSLITLKIFYNI